MLRVVCVAITLSGVWAGVNEASKKILEENARRLGVVTLEPGLQYRILPEGHCEHSCLAGTLCQFHYAEAERRATISVIEKVDESKQKKSDFMCTCRMPITFASSQVPHLRTFGALQLVWICYKLEKRQGTTHTHSP